MGFYLNKNLVRNLFVKFSFEDYTMQGIRVLGFAILLVAIVANLQASEAKQLDAQGDDFSMLGRSKRSTVSLKKIERICARFCPDANCMGHFPTDTTDQVQLKTFIRCQRCVHLYQCDSTKNPRIVFGGGSEEGKL